MQRSREAIACVILMPLGSCNVEDMQNLSKDDCKRAKMQNSRDLIRLRFHRSHLLLREGNSKISGFSQNFSDTPLLLRRGVGGEV